jgi:hypothetical protein
MYYNKGCRNAAGFLWILRRPYFYIKLYKKGNSCKKEKMSADLKFKKNGGKNLWT